MTKKCSVPALALACILTVGLAGCTEKRDPVPKDRLMELPDQLTIEAKVPEQFPAALPILCTEGKVIEEELALKAFSTEKFPDRQNFVGTVVLSRQTTGLPQDAVEMALRGSSELSLSGFSYVNNFHKNWHSRLYNANFFKRDPSIPRDSQLPWLFNQDFKTEGDLPFGTLENAIALVEDKMQTMDFPEHRLEKTYLIDHETLNRYRELSNSEYQKGNSAILDYVENEFTADDDFYLLYFRQYQNDVPFCSFRWNDYTLPQNDYNASPSIVACVSKDGLLYLDHDPMLQCTRTLEECPILPPTYALNLFFDDYSRYIHLDPTVIQSVELNYITLREGKELRSVPAWVILYQSDTYMTMSNETEPGHHLFDLSFVVRADTGEAIRDIRFHPDEGEKEGA